MNNMTALNIMRVLLGVLEFIEFLVSPIGLIFSAYISLYYVLMQVLSSNFSAAVSLLLVLSISLVTKLENDFRH